MAFERLSQSVRSFLASRRNRELLFYVVLFVVAVAMSARRLLSTGSDFLILLKAARELHEPGVDLYRNQTEFGGPYPYPHFLLLPLRLLLQLPEPAILFVWCLGLGAASVILLRSLQWFIELFRPVNWVPVVLFFVLFGRCLTHNYTKGQGSLWIAALVLYGLRAVLEDRPIKGGLALGLATGWKLTPVAYLGLLFVWKKWKAGAVQIATVLVLVFALPLLAMTPGEHLRHLGNFHRAMIAPLFGGEAELAEVWRGISASVSGTFDFVLTTDTPMKLDVHPRIADLDRSTIRVLKLVWTAMLLGFGLWGFLRARALPAPRSHSVQAAIGMLLLVLLQPLTRVYHLANVVLASALFCFWAPVARPAGRAVLWWTTLALFAFAFPLRIKKVIGMYCYLLFQTGLLHVALVALLVWTASGGIEEAKASSGEGAADA
ncbi:MAG: glycosyltransferase family 87 protein [Planctomycetota bacterium]